MKISAILEEKDINAMQTLSGIDCGGFDCDICPLQRRTGLASKVCICVVATDLLKQNGIGTIEQEGE